MIKYNSIIIKINLMPFCSYWKTLLPSLSFSFSFRRCSLSTEQPLVVDLFLSWRSFVFYGLPAPGFPRSRARRGRAGKAISRKWRARYTGRRAVQFRISNWYPRARQKVRRYGATKVRFVAGRTCRVCFARPRH